MTLKNTTTNFPSLKQWISQQKNKDEIIKLPNKELIKLYINEYENYMFD